MLGSLGEARARLALITHSRTWLPQPPAATACNTHARAADCVRRRGRHDSAEVSCSDDVDVRRNIYETKKASMQNNSNELAVVTFSKIVFWCSRPPVRVRSLHHGPYLAGAAEVTRGRASDACPLRWQQKPGDWVPRVLVTRGLTGGCR